MTNKTKKGKVRSVIPSRGPRRSTRGAAARLPSGEERPTTRERKSATAEAEPTPRRSGSRREGAKRPPERTAPTLASFPRRRVGERREDEPRNDDAAPSDTTATSGDTNEAASETTSSVTSDVAPPSERTPRVASEPPAKPAREATGRSRRSETPVNEEPRAAVVPLAANEKDDVSENEGGLDRPEPDEIEELPVDSTSEDIGMLGIGSRVYPPNFDFELFESDLTTNDFEPVADPSVEARIRDIEARLDGLMEGVEFSPSVTPLGQPVPQAQAEEAVDAARELLESDYYRRHFGRAALRKQEGGVDEFGLDPDTEARLRPLLDFLYQRWFRVEVEGIENVPARGRAVVVANHSGALPFDGAMLRTAMRHAHPKARDLRWLAEDFSFYLPFLGVTMNRLGAVRACQENATRLLLTDHAVAVFPEGAEGIKKLYRYRYQLQRFGRGGYVRLCLKTQSPIVPCAIIGAEETNPILYRFDNLSKLIGLDYLPITPTFPLLGPLGLLPAPTKWRVLFGEPISVEEYGPGAADDYVLVGRLSERVRTAINGLLETGLRRRRSIWF
ncbi:MAG TPA: 1-acyl-sn-glycerol-3-phosphate acyltransferase [Polyangiaceae bacterium]|nr:1-acyl-sn-glycerol-3-phosphate acyltransferase [Polyangiaceae bacterium]